MYDDLFPVATRKETASVAVQVGPYPRSLTSNRGSFHARY